MPITKATDNDDDDMGFVEEDSAYNFRQLMDMVIDKTDLIFTVPSDQVDMLKEGLVTRKSKDAKQAKNKGLLPLNGVLSFNVYPATDEKGKPKAGQSCVRVKLGERKSVNILAVEEPSNEL